MIGATAAALALSSALVVFPSSPRRRFGATGPTRRRVEVGAPGFIWMTAAAALLASVVLPLATVLAVVVVAASGAG